ncbi:MAG: hypothetical protein E7Z78_08940 [Methanobrevibacter thaueri]|jgi:tetratricopeptide (TPR) repeat protein|uniref:hypothetical protein n=1 Tax=Methanobrevibacter thaueri TaxID=190975 RepID=UPI0026F0E59E|nr:hypothetical protein [Methanobrevibacter thaueri]MBE6496553.1 hypothetical protein [Methanobrevibacter thaueri]
MKDYLNIDDNGQTTFKVSQTPKIDFLIKEKRFDEALTEINKLLKTDNDYSNWNLKGIVLDKLSQFEESIECFDKALQLHKGDDIKLNKANALYDWAKVTFFPEGNYEQALELINNGLDTLPEIEDPSEFYFLKAEILEAQENLIESQKCYLIAHKEFDRLKEFESQTDYLNNTSDTLINIVGSDFYSFTPEPGVIVDLVKDEENEHDPDAIAVVFENKTVGYVANSDYTLIDEVKSASSIKNFLLDNQKAEIQFVYMGEYVIGKLL